MGRHSTSTGPRRGARRAIAAATVLVVAALGILPASAFWSVGTTATSSGAARIATVPQGATPSASATNRSDVSLSWSAATLSNGRAVSGYTVTRYNEAGVAQSTLAGCSGLVTATTCTETALPDGVWTYDITPRFAANFVGAPSVRSAAVRTDGTAPVNTISRTAVSGGSFLSGATLYYRGAAAGSVALVNTLTDSGSGPASSTTGGFTGASDGFSHTPSVVSTPAGGPFASNPFSWAAGTTTQPNVGIAGADAYGNVAGSTIAFALDNTPPTGGAIGYANGYTTATTTQVTVAAVADAASGLSGSRELQRAVAPLSGNVCGAYGAFSTVLTGIPASASTLTAGTPSGSCYRFQYVVTDNVGNSTTTTSANVVKARNYALVVAADSPANYFRLDDATTSTVVDDYTATGNNGTWFNAPTRGAAGAIVGDGNTAVTFDGVNDYGSITRQISGDFSIELWMRTTQAVGSTGNNWYNGVGLVDGEIAGVANDFGLALLSGGRIGAGTGSPDTTALSAAGYNDGQWHHVVMTRTQATGVIELYVDGVRTTATSTNRAALTGPASLSIGRLQTGINYYAGTLDEIALYPRVLTAAQVANHNLSGRN